MLQSPESFFEAIFQGKLLPYKRIACPSKRVSDSLASEIASWALYPVLINAPTGSGKSTFIFKELADYAKGQGRSILVLSNRISLNEQQKLILCHLNDMPHVGSPMLDEQHKFGNVFVYTYQSILSWLQSPVFPIDQNGGPLYIVFDEAHFFCSDAIFNAWTESILYALIARYPLAVRIYMSATPEDVKPAISAIEYDVFNYLAALNDTHIMFRLFSVKEEDRVIREYYFKPEFNHISLRFFQQWDTISDLIKRQSDNSKWLIFVNNKDTGKKLREALSKETADYIDASMKLWGSAPIRTLTRRQRFDKKVLISTSVIDNGISLYDDKLKHIVIDFVDFTELIQMMGRKRIEEGEKITVYVHIPKLSDIQKYQEYTENLYGTLRAFEQNPASFFHERWGNLVENEQKLFAPRPYFNSVVFGTNTFARYQLARQCGKYEELEDAMSIDENAYAKNVCQWLHKEFSLDMLLDKTLRAQIVCSVSAVLESYLDKPISAGDEIAELEQRLRSLLTDSLRSECKLKSDGNSRGAANIGKIIKTLGLPYKLSDKSENKYHIIKIDESGM